MSVTPVSFRVETLVYYIRQANGMLTQLEQELLAPFGISRAQWDILNTIGEEPLTVSQIARALGLTRQSVQRSTNSLFKGHFVELLVNPEHKTAPLVGLSRQGLTILKEVNAARSSWFGGLNKDIEPFTVGKLVQLLRDFCRQVGGTQV